MTINIFQDSTWTIDAQALARYLDYFLVFSYFGLNCHPAHISFSGSFDIYGCDHPCRSWTLGHTAKWGFLTLCHGIIPTPPPISKYIKGFDGLPHSRRSGSRHAVPILVWSSSEFFLEYDWFFCVCAGDVEALMGYDPRCSSCITAPPPSVKDGFEMVVRQ